MIPTDRFERQLPMALTDLAAPRTPDYLTDILGRTARTRQRPAWASIERWLPMELVTTRVPVTRLPMRQVGVLALIAILLAALLAVYIGTHTPRLPAPFGPAGNGLIAYSKDGDIYTVDPQTGRATAIVSGPETDLDPKFSPDGTRINFVRERGTAGRYDLAVANADGSGVRVVTTDPLPEEAAWEFTADGQGMIASGQTGIQRIDIRGTTPPTNIGTGRYVAGAIRATDGAILFESGEVSPIDLWVMDADGSNKRLLWDPHVDGNYSDILEFRWSPDGHMIAFTCSDLATHEGSFICVMNEDGTGIRRLTMEGPDWVETNLRWSPDSTEVAFNRWQYGLGNDSGIRPIGVASIDGGPVRSVGDAPVSDGALFEYSPDGKSLVSIPFTYLGSKVGMADTTPVIIDVASGAQREMSFRVPSSLSWQRVAP